MITYNLKDFDHITTDRDIYEEYERGKCIIHPGGSDNSGVQSSAYVVLSGEKADEINIIGSKIYDWVHVKNCSPETKEKVTIITTDIKGISIEAGTNLISDARNISVRPAGNGEDTSHVTYTGKIDDLFNISGEYNKTDIFLTVHDKDGNDLRYEVLLKIHYPEEQLMQFFPEIKAGSLIKRKNKIMKKISIESKPLYEKLITMEQTRKQAAKPVIGKAIFDSKSVIKAKQVQIKRLEKEIEKERKKIQKQKTKDKAKEADNITKAVKARINKGPSARSTQNKAGDRKS